MADNDINQNSEDDAPAYVSQEEHQRQLQEAMERVKSELAQEFDSKQNEFKQSLVESIAGKPTAQVVDEDTPPWIKENRTTNPKEFADWTAQTVEKRIAAKANEYDQQLKDQKRQQEEVENQTVARINKEWDDQIADMEASGLIPEASEELKQRIANRQLTDADKNDPAYIAQTQLFAKMAEINTKANEGKGRRTNNLLEVYYRHVKPKQRNTHEDVPDFSNPPAMNSNDDEFSYAEIHNANLSDFKER
jgi:hypothetical protein